MANDLNQNKRNIKTVILSNLLTQLYLRIRVSSLTLRKDKVVDLTKGLGNYSCARTSE